MNDFPLVSLGQGDYRRDLRPSEIAKKGLDASINLIMAAVFREPAERYHARAKEFLSSHALARVGTARLIWTQTPRTGGKRSPTIAHAPRQQTDRPTLVS